MAVLVLFHLENELLIFPVGSKKEQKERWDYNLFIVEEAGFAIKV